MTGYTNPQYEVAQSVTMQACGTLSKPLQLRALLLLTYRRLSYSFVHTSETEIAKMSRSFREAVEQALGRKLSASEYRTARQQAAYGDTVSEVAELVRLESC